MSKLCVCLNNRCREKRSRESRSRREECRCETSLKMYPNPLTKDRSFSRKKQPKNRPCNKLCLKNQQESENSLNQTAKNITQCLDLRYTILNS